MENQKGFTLMEVLIAIIMIFCLLFLIYSTCFFIKTGAKAITKIDKEGVKSVITRVWEGKENRN